MEIMLHKYHQHQARFGYIKFLFVREFDIWRSHSHSLKESDSKQKDFYENVGCFDSETGNLQYGYYRNTLFGRYFENALSRQTIHSLRVAQIFGQPIVIDCGLDQLMVDYEIRSCIRQIQYIYKTNRYSGNPFHLLFTDFGNQESRIADYIREKIPQSYKRAYFNLHSESYQELLPGAKFIYLSPDARQLMEEFDPDAVYIIGGLVSKTNKAPLTLKKALEEGHRCQRLPIHHYVQLKPMVKRVLSFRSVFEILLHLKNGSDWSTAILKSIQPHKLRFAST
ncbi:mitochondrial ribonuclease P protein 1-like protein [Sarcoptes scabiei]|uniref:RNA (guanine-9-)-methyltransferase domain-containing protein 1 n=1 Tax=Sarcoptes scabiei TaxID=52283 RepID=A0A132A0B5_SARSC|nr:mitochondrial ribonuclease P protein 1-like protein [Sarcoptes scabiei]